MLASFCFRASNASAIGVGSDVGDVGIELHGLLELILLPVAPAPSADDDDWNDGDDVDDDDDVLDDGKCLCSSNRPLFTFDIECIGSAFSSNLVFTLEQST